MKVPTMQEAADAAAIMLECFAFDLDVDPARLEAWVTSTDVTLLLDGHPLGDADMAKLRSVYPGVRFVMAGSA